MQFSSQVKRFKPDILYKVEVPASGRAIIIYCHFGRVVFLKHSFAYLEFSSGIEACHRHLFLHIFSPEIFPQVPQLINCELLSFYLNNLDIDTDLKTFTPAMCMCFLSFPFVLLFFSMIMKKKRRKKTFAVAEKFVW